MLAVFTYCISGFLASTRWLEDWENFTTTPEESDQYSANYSFQCNTSIKLINFYQ
jgi:hypothetical protein